MKRGVRSFKFMWIIQKNPQKFAATNALSERWSSHSNWSMLFRKHKAAGFGSHRKHWIYLNRTLFLWGKPGTVSPRSLLLCHLLLLQIINYCDLLHKMSVLGKGALWGQAVPLLLPFLGQSEKSGPGLPAGTSWPITLLHFQHFSALHCLKLPFSFPLRE